MRWFRSVLLSPVIALSVLGVFAGKPVRAGDDAQFTLVVAREYNLWHARGADQHVYIDEKFLGAVSNGYRVRFAVPTNATGNYSVRVRFWDSFITGGIVKAFSAKPGDEVIVRTGTDYALTDSTAIRSVHVFPLASAKLLVNPPPGGITLTFNGHEHRIDSLREITTPERTTENRSLRLEIAADRADRRDKVIVFARPGKTSLLDFTQHSAHDDDSICASIQLLTQLRACVFHHLGGNLNDLHASIGRMEADIRTLHANGADQEASTCVRDTYPTSETS